VKVASWAKRRTQNYLYPAAKRPLARSTNRAGAGLVRLKGGGKRMAAP
jgi:hypothetical protein